MSNTNNVIFAGRLWLNFGDSNAKRATTRDVRRLLGVGANDDALIAFEGSYESHALALPNLDRIRFSVFAATCAALIAA